MPTSWEQSLPLQIDHWQQWCAALSSDWLAVYGLTFVLGTNFLDKTRVQMTHKVHWLSIKRKASFLTKRVVADACSWRRTLLFPKGVLFPVIHKSEQTGLSQEIGSDFVPNSGLVAALFFFQRHSPHLCKISLRMATKKKQMVLPLKWSFHGHQSEILNKQRAYIDQFVKHRFGRHISGCERKQQEQNLQRKFERWTRICCPKGIFCCGPHLCTDSLPYLGVFWHSDVGTCMVGHFLIVLQVQFRFQEKAECQTKLWEAGMVQKANSCFLRSITLCLNFSRVCCKTEWQSESEEHGYSRPRRNTYDASMSLGWTNEIRGLQRISALTTKSVPSWCWNAALKAIYFADTILLVRLSQVLRSRCGGQATTRMLANCVASENVSYVYIRQRRNGLICLPHVRLLSLWSFSALDEDSPFPSECRCRWSKQLFLLHQWLHRFPEQLSMALLQQVNSSAWGRISICEQKRLKTTFVWSPFTPDTNVGSHTNVWVPCRHILQNLQDSAGEICPEQLFLTWWFYRRVRKYPTISTSEAIKQGKYSKIPNHKRDTASHKCLVLPCPPGNKDWNAFRHWLSTQVVWLQS